MTDTKGQQDAAPMSEEEIHDAMEGIVDRMLKLHGLTPVAIRCAAEQGYAIAERQFAANASAMPGAELPKEPKIVLHEHRGQIYKCVLKSDYDALRSRLDDALRERDEARSDLAAYKRSDTFVNTQEMLDGWEHTYKTMKQRAESAERERDELKKRGD